jgi:hypothetical protein
VADIKAVYEIVVMGSLDPYWADYLAGAVVGAQPRGGKGCATLVTASVDQAGLRGLLSRLWDLNLTVWSVNRRGQKCATDDYGGRSDG